MTLHARLVGSGRPNVLFLHGLFGQGRNWSGIAKALQPVATSVLFDLPNHGRSPHTDHFSYVDMADAVAHDLTERLGSAAAITVVGHSMGGKVAMRLALDHPDAVERLAVVDISPVRTITVRTNFTGIVNGLRRVNLARLASRSDAERQLAASVPDEMTRAFLLQNLHFDHGRPTHPTIQRHWRWQMNLRVLGDHLDQIGDWPQIGGTTYDGPVVWIGGQNSDYIQPEHHDAMRAHFPRMVNVTMKGAGHLVHADQPDAFVRTLRAFLEMPTAASNA